MTRERFGTTPEGREVEVLTIGVAPGPVVGVLTLGATVHSLEVESGDGRRRDVVLGHGTPAERLASGDYVGGTIGRYANRIAGGRFELDGHEVVVGAHDRGNSLHGGPDGFDRRVWDVVEHGPSSLALRLVSPDGDQGFPGTLTVDVRYEVDGETVRVTHEATTDATTLCNLTNHAYFNLDGDGAGSADDHRLGVAADAFTPVDDTGVPFGDHAPVAGTPFDLREPTRVGTAVRTHHEQLVDSRGIDHNLVLTEWQPDGVLRRAATLASPASGTTLELWCDQPGLQVYTGNFLDGSLRSADGVAYRQGDGVALEPQLFPDSPHHPDWPSAVLRPGERYVSRLEWRFSRR